MKAMVLCAGLGERLRPITERLPKPLFPVFDKPLIYYALRKLHDAGIREAIINLHHLPEQIRRVCGDEYAGVRLTYSHEREILGPVGGIKYAEAYFGCETFVVVNGDIWFGQEIAPVIDFHREKHAALTMVALENGDPALKAIGFDDDLRVRQVWGKPERPGGTPRRGVNAGIFVYEPRALDFCPANRCFFDFSKGLLPKLFDADAPMFAFPSSSEWSDAGTPERCLQLHWDLLEGRFPPPNGEVWKIDNGVFAREDVAAPSAANLRPPLYIGAGCMIEDDAAVGPFAALGAGCVIGAGARIENSIVLPGAHVPPGAVATGEILFD